MRILNNTIKKMNKMNKLYILYIMKKFLFLTCVFLLFTITIFSISKPKVLTGITIVLDAGHGGMDQGTSFEGISEAKINLQIVKKLESKLKQMGCTVILTRMNEDDLSNASENKNREDLKNRINIINDEKNDLLISVHMNSYQNSNVQGFHVFYKQNSLSSQEFANIIQNQANNNLNQDKKSKQGNFYILNYSRIPGVLIECGFLSNEVDRNHLVEEEYQNKIVDIIIEGIMKYFENII